MRADRERERQERDCGEEVHKMLDVDRFAHKQKRGRSFARAAEGIYTRPPLAMEKLSIPGKNEKYAESDGTNAHAAM